jgi:hypothetical protein
MQRLHLGSGPVTALAIPRVRVERFCGLARRRVHLLGEVLHQKTHHRQNENTVPCLDPDPCPHCAEPLWKTRVEHFAPALMMDEKLKMWVPIVAVFTPGGRNKLDKKDGPYRGRMLEVYRQKRGNAQGGDRIHDAVREREVTRGR